MNALLLLLGLAAAFSVDTGSWPNMTVAQMSEWFWGPSAARLPGKDFVDAVQARSTVPLGQGWRGRVADGQANATVRIYTRWS